MERSERENETRSRWDQWVRDRDGKRLVHTNPARLMYRVLFVCCVRCCIARFFRSYRLLFISTNVQLYWSAIYQPRSSPQPLAQARAPPATNFFPFGKTYLDLPNARGWKFATIGFTITLNDDWFFTFSVPYSWIHQHRFNLRITFSEIIYLLFVISCANCNLRIF